MFVARPSIYRSWLVESDGRARTRLHRCAVRTRIRHYLAIPVSCHFGILERSRMSFVRESRCRQARIASSAMLFTPYLRLAPFAFAEMNS
jgi:hypothetical protein